MTDSTNQELIERCAKAMRKAHFDFEGSPSIAPQAFEDQTQSDQELYRMGARACLNEASAWLTERATKPADEVPASALRAAGNPEGWKP
jgi:UDP-N-acetylglucosamine enolpyruvyl transferase